MKRNRRAIRAIDDLANEIFLLLLSDLDELAVDDPQGSLYRTILDVEEKFHSKRTAVTEHVDSTKDQPESTRELAGLVDRAIAALPPEQREVLMLHVGQGLSCLQIAQRTGVAREDVLKDLVCAYAHLRLEIGGEDLLQIYMQ